MMMDGKQWISDFRPLLIDGQALYASKRNHLYVSYDWGGNFEYIAKYNRPFLRNQVFGHRLTERVAREGFHSLQVLDNETLIAVVRKKILIKKKNDVDFREVFNIKRGSRPLNLCVSQNGKIYFGEYFDNSIREEVYIYGSDDGENWEIVHTFQAGKIRHVHGIFFDPYRKGMWVLTGDTDEESGIWWTPDEFGTLSCLVTGTQQARAVEIIPLQNNLIVPMDTPLEQNFIHSFDTNTLQFSKLASLSGSAFHARGDDKLALVTTVVEPSTVNKTEHVSVWAGGNNHWKCIKKIKQDRWSALSYYYFRYPELEIYTGESSPYFFLYGRGITGIDGHMIRWQKTNLIEEIKASAIAEKSQA